MPPPLAITLTAENYHRYQREGRPGFQAQMSEQGHTSRQDILEVAAVPAPSDVAQRLGLDEGQDVVMRRLRFVVDELPVQLVRVYYKTELVAGSKLEQPVVIPDGVHAELRRLGVRITRFIEDFMGARLPNPGGASAPASKRCTGDSKYPNGLRWRSTRRGNGHHLPWRGGNAPLRDQAMKRPKRTGAA